MRTITGFVVAALLAGCAAPGADTGATVGTLAPDAVLDARGLGRGAAAARPAAVQVRDDPSSPVVLYTVAPRLQTGSPTSLPMVVTSLGAERPRAGGAVAYRALVEVSNARGQAGFARAETRQGERFDLRSVARENRCGGPGGCLFHETLLLTLPADSVRRAAEAGQPIRLRLLGNAAFVEVGIPAGHLRALTAATGG
jgi:hypothetical protein